MARPTLLLKCESVDHVGDPLITVDRSPFVLGRDRHCDAHVPLPDVSKRHATFQHDGGRWTITDLDSTNGTYLCGTRLKPHVPAVVGVTRPRTMPPSPGIQSIDAKPSRLNIARPVVHTPGSAVPGRPWRPDT